MLGIDDLANSSNMDKDNNNRIEAEEAKESDDGKKQDQAMEAVSVWTIPAGQPK